MAVDVGVRRDPAMVALGGADAGLAGDRTDDLGQLLAAANEALRPARAGPFWMRR